MPLLSATRAALELKADVALDTADQCWAASDREGGNEWKTVAEDCFAALKDDSIRFHKAAIAELQNHLDADMTPSERRAILTDLCRAGHFERFHPAVIHSRKPRLLTVDRQQFVVG